MKNGVRVKMLLFSLSVYLKRKKNYYEHKRSAACAHALHTKALVRRPQSWRGRGELTHENRQEPDEGGEEPEEPSRWSSGLGLRARCGAARGVGVARGREDPHQPTPAQAQRPQPVDGAGLAWVPAWAVGGELGRAP